MNRGIALSPMLKTALIAAIALIVGLILGLLLGRFTLERKWSQPYTQAPALPAGGSEQPQNPSPFVGSRVLKPMPIGKTREVLRAMTDRDPVSAPVAAVGAGESGVELHVVVENRSPCTVTSLEGVAYGFDAYGKPSVLNSGKATYVAFSSSAALEPGKKATVALPLRGAELATLAVAHVDRTACADGTSWKRP